MLLLVAILGFLPWTAYSLKCESDPLRIFWYNSKDPTHNFNFVHDAASKTDDYGMSLIRYYSLSPSTFQGQIYVLSHVFKNPQGYVEFVVNDGDSVPAIYGSEFEMETYVSEGAHISFPNCKPPVEGNQCDVTNCTQGYVCVCCDGYIDCPVPSYPSTTITSFIPTTFTTTVGISASDSTNSGIPSNSTSSTTPFLTFSTETPQDNNSTGQGINYSHARKGLQKLANTTITSSNVKHAMQQALNFSRLGDDLGADDITCLSIVLEKASLLPDIPKALTVNGFPLYMPSLLVFSLFWLVAFKAALDLC
ncbi:hypothetical protein L596_029040 [Steinernema carpocapsae]|uniref:EGF-like domain-containing protein n=1 Tax=Steinernema carpocapsae TaxID=34508 RepID=A0A4U5LTG2_STECR|nr:hypothetical protein L596_029040 [Steinernema carpocapsae]